MQAHALRTDLCLSDKRIKAGITDKRSIAMDQHWPHWDEFCLVLGNDPCLRDWKDPISKSLVNATVTDTRPHAR
jgi:hypothetical protein